MGFPILWDVSVAECPMDVSVIEPYPSPPTAADPESPGTTMLSNWTLFDDA